MRGEGGFTLLEVLVSLAIFAIVAVGAVGVLGATNGGGFLSGLPTGFATTRAARDITAASVYLNAFEEFVAWKGSANATTGSYCVGDGCSPEVALPSGLSGYPEPPGEAYQLDWTKLDVLIELWYWNTTSNTFTTTNTGLETLTRVRATLTWELQGYSRSVTVDRFIR
ncbi:MAG TPA: type II secretion system protein [bacterium]|jgi:prepilin-type N-terminal cleavage/methylation domain-containing protein